MSIVIAIIAFAVIIIVHECGHFLSAKAFGMTVHEFSIGMGPCFFRKKGKKTDFCLRALPIGGSVQLDEDIETEDPNSFRNKPVWQRMIVIVAGAVMNLVLGFIICIFGTLSSDNIATTQISGFKDGSVSSEFLQPGDEITKINGMSIWTTMDISYSFQNSAAKADEMVETVFFDFEVRRGNEYLSLEDVPFEYAQASDTRSAGIVIDFFVNPAEKNFFSVVSDASRTFLTEARLIWITLVDLVSGSYGINDLSGPIGVVSSIGQVSALGLSSLLTMIAFITINIGIFNLLPIPALDGARFVFLLIEAIRRKPIKAEHEGMVHFIGLAALMLLMLVVTFNDIVKLFQ